MVGFFCGNLVLSMPPTDPSYAGLPRFFICKDNLKVLTFILIY